MIRFPRPSGVSLQPRAIRRWRPSIALLGAILLTGLAAWAPSFSAIVELGRKGQQAASGSSTIRIFLLSGNNFEEKVHQPGDLAETILGRLRTAIDGHVSFAAALYSDATDPNRNAIDIMRYGLVRPLDPVEPYRVEVFESDPGIRGAGIEYPNTDARDRVIYRAPDAVSGNGNVKLELTLVTAGLHSFTVTTAGKSAAQVNAELLAALATDGFTTTDLGGGNFGVTRFSDTFTKILWSHTDSGVTVSGVAAEPFTLPPEEPGPAGEGLGVPTLSGWGMVGLVLLLGGAAVLVLIRRGGAGSA